MKKALKRKKECGKTRGRAERRRIERSTNEKNRMQKGCQKGEAKVLIRIHRRPGKRSPRE